MKRSKINPTQVPGFIPQTFSNGQWPIGLSEYNAFINVLYRLHIIDWKFK